MRLAEIEDIALTVLVTAMVAYMLFIIYDLSKRSKAGKFGTFILFFALGLGIFGFVMKTIIISLMEGAAS